MAAMDFAGKTAMVTDGCSEIGFASARLLSGAGAHIVVSGSDSRLGKRAAAAIGAGTQFVTADLADLGSVDHLARQMPVDVLVNTAMVHDFATVRGLYFLVAAVAPGMQRLGGGAIVNLTTGNSTAAAMVAALTRTWAVEFADAAVRVNTVAAGLPHTAAACPLGRGASPFEIAHPIVFLASWRAGAVNGIILDVDGGAAATPSTK